MIHASLYGRLGQDPQALTTKNGKPMARASIAVEVTPYNGETPDSEWFGVIAFGRVAEDLLRCRKGQLVAVSGPVTRNRWRGKDGQERSGWQVTANDVHASSTVRPRGGRRKAPPQAAPPRYQEEEIPW